MPTKALSEILVKDEAISVVISRGNEVANNPTKHEQLHDMFIVDFMRTRAQVLGMPMQSTCNVVCRMMKH